MVFELPYAVPEADASRCEARNAVRGADGLAAEQRLVRGGRLGAAGGGLAGVGRESSSPTRAPPIKSYSRRFNQAQANVEAQAVVTPAGSTTPQLYQRAQLRARALWRQIA